MMSEAAADKVKQLMQRKDEIEAELLAIASELTSPGPNGQAPVGFKGNLVDREGYPRNDVDIMRITKLRNRHAILNTDLSEIMKEIEQGLYQLHATVPKQVQAVEQSAESAEDPFLIVNTVSPDSPAFLAGLREKDSVTRFGTIKRSEFESEGFSLIPKQIVEGKALRVNVIRNGERKIFTLVPQKWSGQGLMGCHLIKYQD